MARPSFTIPDDLLEDFDRAIIKRKANDELPMDANRSQLVREFMEEFVEETEKGNSTPEKAMMAAD